MFAALAGCVKSPLLRMRWQPMPDDCACCFSRSGAVRLDRNVSAVASLSLEDLLTTPLAAFSPVAPYHPRRWHSIRPTARDLSAPMPLQQDSTAAMSRPGSPRQAFPGDLSADFGITAAPHCPFSPNGLPHIQPPSSPPSLPPAPRFMASASSATPNSRVSRFQPSLMDINEGLQWSSGCDLPLCHLSQDPSNYQMAKQYTPESSVAYNYTSQRLPYRPSYNIAYSTTGTESSYPRTYTSLGLVGSVGNMTDSYPPSAYLLEPQKSQEILDMSSQLTPGSMCHFEDDFEGQRIPMKSEDINYGHSQFDSDISMQNTIPTPEPPAPSSDAYKRETLHEEGNVDKEQPYAQLIYRALMEAQGHTMVLRDIYNWFKRNTDKATDKETKGWQNSIRHNLSMNGAFEKVDQPAGEEAKKGFMWRLTESAIREGVKSTTRYRSKLPNKRGCRSQNPAPQRQASGAKGGQAARKAARLRRSERLKETRSVPMHNGDTYQPRPGSPYNTGLDNFGPSDLAMSYPASPYYCHSEMDFGPPIKQEALPTSFGPNLDILSGQSYPDSPQGLYPDMQYLLPYSPEEPLFYGSGSESGSEPMTPSSLDYCSMDMSMQPEPACFSEAENHLY